MFNFDTFYITWYARAKRFATFYLKNEEEAEDVVQDVFVTIYKNRFILDETRNEVGYLFTSLKNTCLTHIRLKHHKKQQTSIDKLSAQQELLLAEEALEHIFTDFRDEKHIQQLIEEAINKLPPRCREIFIMCKIHKKTQIEVAQSLGLSHNTIETQMGIAYKKLRVLLRDILPFVILFGVFDGIIKILK